MDVLGDVAVVVVGEVVGVVVVLVVVVFGGPATLASSRVPGAGTDLVTPIVLVMISACR